MVFHKEHKRWGWRNIQWGGIKNLTIDGEEYVARKFKRPVCWIKGHDVVIPKNPDVENVCVRCGKRDVKARKA